MKAFRIRWDNYPSGTGPKWRTTTGIGWSVKSEGAKIYVKPGAVKSALNAMNQSNLAVEVFELEPLGELSPADFREAF